MKTLAEMTTGELWGLKADYEAAIREQGRRGWSPDANLVYFRNQIDDDLDRRGA